MQDAGSEEGRLMCHMLCDMLLMRIYAIART